MIARFDQDNFHGLCDRLAAIEPSLQQVLDLYGYPPMWSRPNTFETLVLTILEQQVSLASAYAAYKRLKERIGTITPTRLLELDDEALRACAFSRQKIVYVRELAQALIMERISLRKMYHQPDDIIRAELKQLKGIGEWTVDIYLIHALRRTDIFPLGDLALVNAIKMLKGLPGTDRNELLRLALPWQPYRTIATMMFWHYYIKKKNIKLLH